MSRREFVRSASLAGLGALVLSFGWLQPPRTFLVTRHERRVRGLQGPLTVALLTDLHLGPYLGTDDLRRWVDATLAQHPDLVLLGGDVVDRRYRGDLREVQEQLERLEAPAGVFAVLGNHDHARYRNPSRLVDALAEVGVTVLDNTATKVRADLVLAGIDDLRVGRPDLPRTLGAVREWQDRDEALLLMSHNPDVIPDTPDDIDLLVAGHTHGGQVRLPVVGAVVTSSAYGRRFVSGWVGDRFPAFVSRGLGVTTVPFRYDCPAELAVLKLSPG